MEKKKNPVEDMIKKRMFNLSARDRKKRVLELARIGETGLSLNGDEWDQKPYLLTCKNGVVDLKNGQIHAGQPGQYLKTVCPTPYDPNAIPPATYLQFLNTLFDNDQFMVLYIKKLFGLSLIGQYLEPVFPVVYGPTGQNAKGTLIETISESMGRPLAGPRLFDASIVKRLAGGDPILARAPYGKRPVTFNPTHTLFLLTNKLPDSDAWDQAFYTRIHVIPFKYSFVDNPDPTKTYQKKAKKRFKDVLLTEREGILKWLVEGAVEYLKAGNLNQPGQVLAASQGYRDSQDTVLNFKSNCLKDAPGLKISASVLYDNYVDYCGDNDLEHVDSKAFKPLMEKLYDHKRQKDGRFYLEVRIVSTAERNSHLQLIKGDAGDGMVTA
jgi:putative DNA primase/helicase